MKTIAYSHYRKWYTPNICVKIPRLVHKEYIETNLIINFEFLCWTFSFMILSKRKKVDNNSKYKVVWKDKWENQ